VALDIAGNLFIADTQNHRIELLSTSGTLSTIAGTGTSGFAGDGGAATAAALSYPSAVAVDQNENLYIADSGNNCIRMVTSDGTIATIAGTGMAGYTGDSGAALQVALYNPSGVAVDAQGNVYIADTGNNRIRMLAPGQTTVTPPPQLAPVSLTNAASLIPGALAPGEIFSIFGNGIGPASAAIGSYDSNGMLSTTLANVQVMFNSTPAPLFYVQAQQINAQVPYEMAGQASAQLQVVYQGSTVAQMEVALVDANPALFTLNYGTGNAVVLNQDGTINSAQNAAAPGSIVTLYATGEGQTSPAGATGRSAISPYPRPLLPVSLTIADIPASILYAGDAPGFVGLMQIDAQLPTGFVPSGNLSVVLTLGTYQSPPGVTIAVAPL